MPHEYSEQALNLEKSLLKPPRLQAWLCLTCGALVWDRVAHDNWSARLSVRSMPMTPSMIEDRLG